MVCEILGDSRKWLGCGENEPLVGVAVFGGYLGQTVYI